MAPAERRFKFRMILFGLFLTLISGAFLYYLVLNPEMFGDSTPKIGTAVAFIFLGGFLFLVWAIRVKLRQHNIIRW